MEVYILIACAVFFIGAAVTAFLKNVHMFQLNSYGVGTHIKWIVKNPKSWVAGIFALLFGAVSLFSDFILCEGGRHALILHIAFCLVFAVLFLARLKKKKAKTPLVFTARVKRMTVTYIVLALIAVALAFLLPVKGLSLPRQ